MTTATLARKPALKKSPEMVSIDKDRLTRLIEQAEERQAANAGNDDEDAGDGNTQRASAGSMRERIVSGAKAGRKQWDRDYNPGGGVAQGEGPLAELRPSARVLAAHVAMEMEKSGDLAKRVGGGGYAPANMVRSWMGGSGVRSGKRFNSDVVGSGAELVEVCPTEEIWQGAICESMLLDSLNPSPIKGDKMKVVNLSGMPTVYATPVADACDNMPCRTPGTVGTRTHEHPVGKLTVDLCMPVEFTEDAFLDVISEYTDIAENALAMAQEEAIIRGDATVGGSTININNTGAVITLSAQGQPPSWTVFDGIAHSTLVDNTANNAAGEAWWTPGDALTANMIMLLRGLMWDAASKRHFGYCAPDQLEIIVDAQTYGVLVTLEDVKWVEKYGPGATILTGILPTIWGIPIYMSPALALTDINGAVDATTPANNIYGQLHLVNKSGLKLGIARAVSVYTEVDRACDVVHVFISWRAALARRSSTATAAGIEAIASIYGIPAGVA